MYENISILPNYYPVPPFILFFLLYDYIQIKFVVY